MADNVQDNNWIIPYLTGNHTFADWASHYNTGVVNKLNLGKIYNGISGEGIVFTLGTTAANDPVGGDFTSINEGDLAAGTFRCSLADRIPKGITFNQDVSILGELKYDLSRLESPTINIRVASPQGYTGTKGFNFGNPIRVKTSNSPGEEGCTGPPNYYLGKADNLDFAEVMGVVKGVTWPVDDSNNPQGPYTKNNTYIDVVLSGRIKGDFGARNINSEGNTAIAWHDSPTNTGLTAGEIYFVNPGTSGGITPLEPTIGGQVSKPIIMGLTGDEGIVLNYRGQFLQGSGTGGTGGINDNRFWIATSNAALVRGVVAGYDGSNWQVQKAPDELSAALGLVIDRVTLDGTDYIEIVTCGHLNNIPVLGEGKGSAPTGLVYIDSNGKLTSIAPSGSAKPFAVVWPDSAGSGTRRGVIINQTHSGGGGGSSTAESTWPGGGVSQNWAFRSSTSGGATYGSAVNENLMVNGGFDIWQRGVGKDSAFGATGTTYFADRWVRIDGVSGAGGVVGTYSIQRQEFTKNQTDVFGNPKYYLSSSHTIAGTGGHHGDRIVIQNRINDARTTRGQDVTLSFSAKCGITGATLGIVVNQYDGTNSHTRDVALASLGSIWGKHEVSFTMPNLRVSPTGKHYVGVGFDVTKLNTTFDLAKVKLERGLVATVNGPTDEARELEKCSEFYQRTYNVDENTHSVTMLDDNNPSITVLDITTTPMKDYYHRFPVRMNSIPSVTFFSPKSGQTGDAYNRTAEADLRKTAGTNSPHGTRISSTGATTIIAEHKTRDGLYIVIPEGTVLWDQVSTHYVADADLTEDMPNA